LREGVTRSGLPPVSTRSATAGLFRTVIRAAWHAGPRIASAYGGKLQEYKDLHG
jgi:hypothetical protein